MVGWEAVDAEPVLWAARVAAMIVVAGVVVAVQGRRTLSARPAPPRDGDPASAAARS